MRYRFAPLRANVLSASTLVTAAALIRSRNKKARCREEVAAGSISNTAREEVYRTQRRHRIWEE
ncbi:conserved hypothetical protein [Mesorhizobium escarrei]|uniref:Secreted protein n=1 Tax=Mesorhizobium escarrei TaxID=666018 RepID=A0ABM9DY42_9HYPH|nr:conserved hypothetical protein [Mesorhizobium escarrei]